MWLGLRKQVIAHSVCTCNYCTCAIQNLQALSNSLGNAAYTMKVWLEYIKLLHFVTHLDVCEYLYCSYLFKH